VPKVTRKVPAPLVALVAAAIGGGWLPASSTASTWSTIGSKYAATGGIPRAAAAAAPALAHAGPGGHAFALDWAHHPGAHAVRLRDRRCSAPSNRCSPPVVADTMSGTRHEPNSELIAVGIGNVICPFFGGIPATGALAPHRHQHQRRRHLPLRRHRPLASCWPARSRWPAGRLPADGGDGGAPPHRGQEHVGDAPLRPPGRVAPRSDVIVLLTCFSFTVIFDMVIAVSVGVVLAALLFMRRMAEIADTKLETEAVEHFELPKGIRVYEIAGPLFFGAAQKAVNVVGQVHKEQGTVVLNISKVPVMDATGLVALETMLAKLKRSGLKVILAGVNPQPAEVLERAGIRPRAAASSPSPPTSTPRSAWPSCTARASAPPHRRPATERRPLN
jgi:SulP family sulfate permease